MSEANDISRLPVIDGQLSEQERAFITKVIREAPNKPQIAVEVGTWLGGGSTLHILRALHANGAGHLWGVEASKDICEKMLANIRLGAPEAVARFTPLFGLSTDVLPGWLQSLSANANIDVVFLDGGGNPLEQIEEFRLLAHRIKLGGVLMSHDARTRKGKWFVPYISLLDNWKVEILDFTFAGLLHATKLKPEPAPASLNAAERKLRKMRREPKELAARFLPSWVCGLILRALPARLNRRLTVEA